MPRRLSPQPCSNPRRMACLCMAWGCMAWLCTRPNTAAASPALQVLRSKALPERDFGEGVTRLGDRWVQQAAGCDAVVKQGGSSGRGQPLGGRRAAPMRSAAGRQEAAACELATGWGWCGAPMKVLRHAAEGPPMPTRLAGCTRSLG